MRGCLKFRYKASNRTVLSQTKACTAKLSWADNRPLCSISSSDSRVLSFYIPLKWQAVSPSCVPDGIKRSYDTKFKLIVINYDKKTNNCNTATKFSVVESNIWGWMQQKQKLINLSVAPRMDISKHQNSKLLSLCTHTKKKWRADHRSSN